MPVFPQQGGSNGTWGTELRNFFSPYFTLTTGLFVTASIPGWAIDSAIAWTQVVKTGSSLADLTNHDHSVLTSIGTYNHPAIDTFIGTMNTFVATKGQASGLASLDANSLVVQQPAVHTHTSTTTGGIVDHVNLTSIGTNSHSAIDTFIASKAATSGLASLNASSLVVQNPANASATPGANQIPIFDANGAMAFGSVVAIAPATSRVQFGKTTIDNAFIGRGAAALGANIYWSEAASSWKYIIAAPACIIQPQATGGVVVYTAVSGTADANISLSGPYSVHHDGNAGVWTDYSTSSTVTGWSAFTSKDIRYSTIGKTGIVRFTLVGTSNSSVSSFTLPITAASGYNLYFAVKGQDNGVTLTTPSMAETSNGTAVINLYKDMAGNAWTASGTKAIIGSFSYEIA